MKLIEWPYYRTEFLAAQGFSPTFVKRFWSKVWITPKCWVWNACRDPNGYGKMGRWKDNQRPITAHVASWILHHGPLPPGLCVLHRCDHPWCVNPNHLWLGTMQQNTRDMMSKGRDRFHFKEKPPKGKMNKNTKLDDKSVKEIRGLYASGLRSQQSIAEQFGVCQTNISAIIRRLTWI